MSACLINSPLILLCCMRAARFSFHKARSKAIQSAGISTASLETRESLSGTKLDKGRAAHSQRARPTPFAVALLAHRPSKTFLPRVPSGRGLSTLQSKFKQHV